MRIAYVFLICLFSIIGSLTALLGSHAGNQFIIDKLNQTALPLHLELESGVALSQAHWKKIEWQGQLFQLSITDLDYDIDLSCLFAAELCVNHINAAAVSYVMPLNDEPKTLLGIDLADALTRIEKLEQQLEDQDWQLNIPLLINVNRIDIHDINVEVASTTITADRLQGGVYLLGRDITVTELATNNVFVQVLTEPDSEVSSKQAAKESAATSQSSGIDVKNSQLKNKFALYQVAIPLRVDVKNSKLEHSKVQVDDFILEFNLIELVGFIDSGDVKVDKLNVDMPQANSYVTGKIKLQQDYPLSVDVESTLKQPESLKQLSIDLNAAGSLEQMTLVINSTGPIHSKIDAYIEPFRPELPFKIDASWQKLGWPLIEPAFIEATDGKLALQGNLNDYRIDISGALDIESAPPMELDANGKGNLQQLSISQININTLGGNVTASGLVNWVNGISVDSQIITEGINLEQYWPDAQLQPSGSVAIDFKLDPNSNNDWTLDIHDIDVAADLKGYPIIFKGGLLLNQNLHWRLNQFSLARGEDAIKLDGVIGNQFKLGGVVGVKTLSPYLKDSDGSIFGYFSVIGERDKPWLSFELFADNLSLQENSLKRADLTGRISLNERPEGLVSLLSEELNIGDEVINKVALDYTATKVNNSVNLNIENENNNAVLKIDGLWKDRQWQGKVTKGRINSVYGSWVIDPEVEFSFAEENNYLYLQSHCWNEKQAKLCFGFDSTLEEAEQFKFSLENYDINKFGLTTSENVELEGLLNISSEVTWHKNEPLQLASNVNISNGTMLIYNDDERSVANFDKLNMTIGLNENSLTAKVNINSPELGGMTSDIRLDDIFDKRKLTGDINIIDIDLAFFEPLIYQVDVLNGIISGAGIVDGTLTKPEVIGQFNVTNGYLSGDQLPVTLEQFQFSIESTGQAASITGTTNSGQGSAKIIGNVAWGDEFSYSMLLHGNDLEFDDNKGLKLYFSPNINVKGNDKGTKVTGDVEIPSALIKVTQLPRSAIQISNDVIIIDAENASERRNYQLDVAVNIKLLDDVKIDSFGLKSNITGAVSIELDKDGNLFSDGMLQFEEGRYRSFGQDLSIRQGQIVFSGPVENPYINVEAIRNTEITDDDVIVGVRLIGPVKKPVFTMFSEPELEQTRMISYLLRGRDVDSDDETSQDVVITTMLISSSLGQGEDAISFVGDALGVEDFAIDTRGQGEDARVEVSGYVLPGVQIRYGIGLFSALSEVVVRYEVIPKLYIELVTGVDNAVDVYYKFSR